MPVPGFPWIPAVYVAATIWFAAYMALREPVQAILGILTAASGLPFYWLVRRGTRPFRRGPCEPK